MRLGIIVQDDRLSPEYDKLGIVPVPTIGYDDDMPASAGSPSCADLESGEWGTELVSGNTPACFGSINTERKPWSFPESITLRRVRNLEICIA
jgi:hypothetical protein